MLDQLPDLIDFNLKALFCGINPGEKAALVGHHFEGRNNRFWKVMHASGLVPVLLEPKDDSKILEFGFGLTTVVSRPTRSADQLTKEDFLLGTKEFELKIVKYKPQILVFLGKAGYSQLSGLSKFDWGKQQIKVSHIEAWVVPNPSGRNLAFSFDDLVVEYRKLADHLNCH